MSSLPLTVAKPIAPEDLAAGDYVAVLDEEHEWSAASWYCDPPAHAERVIRVRMRPNETTGPLRVVAVCVPFVFVKPIHGEGQTLDLRSVRLARLAPEYAKAVQDETQTEKPSATATTDPTATPVKQ